ATGLASLLESELQVHIGKEMQHHDWRLRPLDAAMLAYLAADVAHLRALEGTLWAEGTGRGLEDEGLEGTRYRLPPRARAAGRAGAPSDVPPYARIKGVDRVPERELAVLRVLADLREEEARRRDVPPHRVASNDALLALARARPSTPSAVARVRGISSSSP